MNLSTSSTGTVSAVSEQPDQIFFQGGLDIGSPNSVKQVRPTPSKFSNSVNFRGKLFFFLVFFFSSNMPFLVFFFLCVGFLSNFSLFDYVVSSCFLVK